MSARSPVLGVSCRADVEVEDIALPPGERGRVLVRIFRPAYGVGVLPVVVYLGAQSAGDDRLVRELAAGVPAAVLVPDADFARQLTVGRELLRWIAGHGERRWLDGGRIALVANGAHAALACRLALAASEENPLLSVAWLGWPCDREGPVLTKLASLLDAVLCPPADVGGEPHRSPTTGSCGG
jgi:acetyl esterase/lipase